MFEIYVSLTKMVVFAAFGCPYIDLEGTLLQIFKEKVILGDPECEL